MNKTHKSDDTFTHRLDNILTSRLWGIPIFIALLVLMFMATFWLGAYPQEWIENGVVALSSWVSGLMTDGPLRDLLVNGIISGMGSVIVFLPNILILFLFISLMEDTGYMARAAKLMDGVMHSFGLHGKSFIPMVMGFGCNTPAIMAARSIEDRKSRIITILINPFMSCSARLPVFVMMAGAFFPRRAGLMLALMYLIGVIVALITARLLRSAFFKGESEHYDMPLTPYQRPNWRETAKHVWEKCAEYIKKIGTVILLASIIVWFLSNYPKTDDKMVFPTEEAALSYHSEHSYLGRIGIFVEPVLKPLGMTWKEGMALVSGIPAKEIIVSTLGVLYANDSSANNNTLTDRLQASGDYTPASAIAFMVFVLLYCPCIASLAAIGKECGGWKWVAFSVAYTTSVAWLVAWIVKIISGIL